MSNNTNRVNNPMKVITGPDTRWSYANVWEPKSINGGTPKYSVSLIIPKSDTKTVAKIKAAIEAAYQEGQAKLKGNGRSVPPLSAIKTPLRDGDIERPDDPAYANAYFINANSATAPGIVDADRNPVLTRSEVYSGVYGRASINLYAFNSNGNKGIACGLNPYDDIMTYLISLPNTVLLILLFAGFTYMRTKRQKNMLLPGGQMATFIFFPLSQVIVMAAAMMIISYYGWFRDKNTGLPFLEDPTRAPMIMLCIAAVLCIISDAVLFYIMSRSAQNEKLREELRIKDYQNALNLEYYRNLENSSGEVRKIRHDLANIIETAYEVVHGGTEVDRESAERMLDQLKTQVEDIKIEKFCLNTLVNAIASNKAKECRENGIAYDFNLDVPKSVGMEEVDVCKAYVNIFDNAINAAEALEDNRYIKIKSFVDENDGMLYISSENAVAPDYEEKKKKRTGEHGYGLKILEETAEKYGGHVAAKQSGGIFTCAFAAKA